MNSISVNGEKYVKASSIAKELGYTADYVGQLARAKKVEAVLVGRTWYVKEDSIKSHKTTRYRSSLTKSKKEIKKLVSEDAESASTGLKSAKDFSYIKNSYHPTVKYEVDEEDLIPILTEVGPRDLPGKSKDLEIELGDAEKVKVHSTEKPYSIITSERPKLTFTGRLKIADEENHPEIEKPKRSGTLKIEKFKPHKVTPVEVEKLSSESHLIKMPKTRKSKGRHVEVIENGPAEEPVRIHTRKSKRRPRSKALRRLTLGLLTSLVFALLFTLTTLEIKTIVDSGKMEKSYSINKAPLNHLKNTLINIVISARR